MNMLRTALAAALGAATLCATAGGARAESYAASQLLGGGFFNVTVSTVPFTRAENDKGVSLPAGGTPGLVTQTVISGGADYMNFTFSSGKSGVYTGTSLAAEAPVAIGGIPVTDSYIVARSDVAELTFLTSSRPDHIDFLWGSVSATDAVNIVTTIGNRTLTGAQILALADAGGVTGTNGSFYVSIDLASASNAIQSVRFGHWASAANPSQEFAGISFNMAARTPQVDMSAIPPPPTPEPPTQGAPAPVLGATPAGGALAFGMLGLLGLGRSRRRAAARA